MHNELNSVHFDRLTSVVLPSPVSIAQTHLIAIVWHSQCHLDGMTFVCDFGAAFAFSAETTVDDKCTGEDKSVELNRQNDKKKMFEDLKTQ